MLERIKIRKIVGVICTILASTSLLFTAAAQAAPFKLTSSGWGNMTEVDGNGNGNPIFVITSFGTGTFGKSVSNAAVESGFVGLCSDPGEPFVFRFETLASSTVMRFASGDLLFTTLATGGPISGFCFDSVTETSAGEAHLVITGGTGKFAGATGTLLITSNAKALLFEGPLLVQFSITNIVEGEIFLSR